MSNYEQSKKSCTIFITSIDVAISEEQLVRYFSSCGNVAACKLCGDLNHPKRFAFIEYTAPREAQKALSLHGSNLGFYSIQVQPSKTAIKNPSYMNSNYQYPTNNDDQYQTQPLTIYVKNIDVRVTEYQLRAFFEKTCGSIVNIILAGDTRHPTRFAFIEFSNEEEVNNALMLNGTVIGSKTLSIVKSTQPIKNRTQLNSEKESNLLNGRKSTHSELEGSLNLIQQQQEVIRKQREELENFKIMQQQQKQQIEQIKRQNQGLVDNQNPQIATQQQQQMEQQQNNAVPTSTNFEPQGQDISNIQKNNQTLDNNHNNDSSNNKDDEYKKTSFNNQREIRKDESRQIGKERRRTERKRSQNYSNDNSEDLKERREINQKMHSVENVIKKITEKN
ncbi:polyadenylate-binding protein-interacting protein [Anaeramoeba flamelloides]|uniref:Polyadenylate-binding protein-interacting protein n=1 Tax=Anaeramoeba flamelloides TaxID=1746091 RepID=A0ABQ8YX00_9EUKA|nr:polyadenylate-binding protein-interacting protein [Anaeramoeba flamelloides]